MQIPSNRIDEETLVALGAKAIGLLCSGEISKMAAIFGYALAYDRGVEVAIREDLAACLSEIGAVSLAPASLARQEVKYFESNDSNLVALVESTLLADNGRTVLAEFIVTVSGQDKFFTLEDISVGP